MAIAWPPNVSCLAPAEAQNEASASYAQAAIHYFFSRATFGPRVPNSK
jgi:hypothetical protein